MSWIKNDDSDVEEEEEDDYINHLAVIIIDNSEKMFEKEDSEESCAFQNCLEALYVTLDKYVFNQWNNKIRIQFLDGREHGIFSDLSKDIIKIMHKLLEIKNKPLDELKAIYCSQSLNNNVVYETFLDASDCLRKNASEKNSKYIAILTNDSTCNNCNVDDDDLERVMESMQSHKIQFIVVPLLSKFNWSKFYGKLVGKTMNDSLLNELTEEGYEDVDDLVIVIDRFIHPKRCVKPIKFFYGPPGAEHNLLVQVRRKFKTKNLYHNAKVDPKTFRECKKHVPEAEIKTEEEEENLTSEFDDIDANMFADEFEPQEGASAIKPTLKELLTDKNFMKALRYQEPKGVLQLLYLSYKRTSAHYINKPAFIIEPNQFKPNHEEIRIFQLLWDHCQDNNKVMVCRYIENPRNKHQLVQLQSQSENGHNYFMAQYLTFFNGINRLAKEEIFRNREPSGADLTVAIKLVDKLTIDDNQQPFRIQSNSFEEKSALIKAELLSTKQEKWNRPEKCVNWPTRSQVSGKLGKELQQEFRNAYGNSGNETNKGNKRKKTSKK